MTDEDDLLAGELSLGLLDGDERAAALRRVIAEPAFARAAERWRDRFAAMAGGWAEVEPGRDAEARVARLVEPAADATRGDDARGWRWLAAVSSLVAAVLLVVVLARPGPAPVPVAPAASPPGTLLVAVFAPSGGEPFGVVYDPRGRDVRLGGSIAVPDGRAVELWAIGGDGVPHAAGLIPAGTGRVALGGQVPIAAGTTLALSIEPAGGSPKPTPTGPVVATGRLAAI